MYQPIFPLFGTPHYSSCYHMLVHLQYIDRQLVALQLVALQLVAQQLVVPQLGKKLD